MPKEEKKYEWNKVDVNFKDKKLAAAYKTLREAFDESRRIIETARGKFEPLLKDALVKAGHAEDPDYILINHRFGLAYAITDEPVEQKQSRLKKSAVSV